MRKLFDERYASHYWNFVVFFVQIRLICDRLYTYYLIKTPEYFEKYRREKEYAEFLEKFGNKIDEDKTGDNKDGNNNNNICEIIFDEVDDNEEYNENQN